MIRFKIILLTILLAALPAIIPIPACSQDISLSDQIVYQGQDVKIPVNYANFDTVDVQSFTVMLRFDTLVVGHIFLGNVQNGWMENNDEAWMIAQNTTTDGIYIISGITAHDVLAANGTLFDLTFSIKSDAPAGSTAISIEMADFYPVDYATRQTLVPIQTHDAVFVVNTLLAGDVNLDGIVTFDDVQIILSRTVGRYSGFEQPWSDQRNLAADFDKNSKIEAFDAEMLYLTIP